ncbi:MAG: pyruvate formate lyase family protein [Kiritimatiellia bacterium]|nr:pyruvate formate lyase family protein [Kiritimatiellia bacterium]
MESGHLSVEVIDHATRLEPPRRLGAATRRLAGRGLAGEFGRALQNADPALKRMLPSGDVSPDTRYAAAVALIAESAPLRILPEERIVGAATYREAACHTVPILDISSTSHLTPGFDRVLSTGYVGLRASIRDRLARGDLDGKGVDFLNALRVCLDAATIWHRRYLEALQQRIAESSGAQKEHYERVIENARRVPEHPPRTFPEALQSLWFLFVFQRLCGNWPGIGRIDQMLGPYLEQDLRAGTITLDEARELLAHFWIKGTEWIGRDASGVRNSGDAQHYQNIILSGIDADGVDVTNEVTYLVLDVVEELHISDFPVGVRLNERSPERLVRRVAEVQRFGGGIVSIYNEDIVIRGLVDLGIPVREARTFANDGCWEVLIPGKTAFGYRPFDMMVPLQQTLGFIAGGTAIPEHPTFESLYQAFRARLAATLEELNLGIDEALKNGLPAVLISLLVEDCVEKGRGYNDRGARYTFYAPHAGGMADVSNSLLAIQRYVFDEPLLTLGELVRILRDDWQGHEELRQRIRREMPCYGNGDPAADAMMKRVFDDYTEIVRQVPLRNGVFRPAGISTFGREIVWRDHREATAHGFRKGDILATNFSPTPGTDKEGPLAAIRSYCAVDFTRLPNGATLEIRLAPSSVSDEAGVWALANLLRAFIRMGGLYLNVDVIDPKMLRDAQKHPEKYPNLVVRISGWCARFHTLDDNWQEMVIRRAESYG